MDEQSPVKSPESNTRHLNPYQSGEASDRRLSSNATNFGCSPANLKLEPVRMVANTTSFEDQRQQSSSPCKTSLSPIKEKKKSVSP